jgi:hypothetical protein
MAPTMSVPKLCDVDEVGLKKIRIALLDECQVREKDACGSAKW